MPLRFVLAPRRSYADDLIFLSNKRKAAIGVPTGPWS